MPTQRRCKAAVNQHQPDWVLNAGAALNRPPPAARTRTVRDERRRPRKADPASAPAGTFLPATRPRAAGRGVPIVPIVAHGAHITPVIVFAPREVTPALVDAN